MAQVDIRAMIVVFLYAVISNLVLISFATIDNSLACPDIKQETVVQNYASENYTDDASLIKITSDTSKFTVLYNLVLGRCRGLEWWVYWITQVPTILGVLFVIRSFVGFT